MYNLVWQSVMCRPGKLLILLVTKNQMLRPTAPTARRRSSPGENAPPGQPDFGRAAPSLRQPIPDSNALSRSLFGAVRRSTMICCRRTRFSASSLARDRKNPISSDHSNLQASHIGPQDHPIRRLAQPDDIRDRDSQSDTKILAAVTSILAGQIYVPASFAKIGGGDALGGQFDGKTLPALSTEAD